MTKTKKVLLIFGISLIVGIGWNLYKYYNFNTPKNLTEINLNQSGVLITKTYNISNNGCYKFGFWSDGNLFDGKAYFETPLDEKNYLEDGEYVLSYSSGDMQIKTININGNNLSSVSMSGGSKSSKVALDRIEVPLKNKYRKITVKLEVKKPETRFLNTSQNIYFFLEKARCPNEDAKHRALIHKNKNVVIDKVETNTTLVPLYNALKNKDSNKVQELINEGLDSKSIMLGNRQPVHYASFFNDDTTLKYLISKNVNLNVKDIFGKTPLHYGIENNATKTVQILLDNGADLSLVERVDNYLKIGMLSYGKHLVITYTSTSYLYKMTEILLVKGLNPNFKKEGHKPILNSLFYDKIDNDNKRHRGQKIKYPYYQKMVDLLKQYGAKTNDELNNMKKVPINTILKG